MDLVSMLVWFAAVLGGGSNGGEFKIERADCDRPTSTAERRVCQIP